MKGEGFHIELNDARRQLPLIKWPGGKRALVGSILQLVPEVFGTYYEPFFGGGAVFFALQPENAVLADANADLINAYIHIRDNPKGLARVLRSLNNSERDYYEVRAAAPRTQIRKAARLLYLTRLSFNGIHRVNLRGEFNVPYGYKTHLTTIDEQHLFCASSVLEAAELIAGDFEETTRDADRGDVAYFDPPYTVAHGLNGFVKYNERIFSWNDQQRLPKAIRLEVTKRQESDDNHRGVREAYFDLIDYRNVALANWTLFQNLLGYGKKNESKDKQTKWMVEINDWRNQVAHASSGVMLRAESLAQLEEYEEWLKKKVTSVGNDEDEAKSESGVPED